MIYLFVLGVLILLCLFLKQGYRKLLGEIYDWFENYFLVLQTSFIDHQKELIDEASTREVLFYSMKQFYDCRKKTAQEYRRFMIRCTQDYSYLMQLLKNPEEMNAFPRDWKKNFFMLLYPFVAKILKYISF